MDFRYVGGERDRLLEIATGGVQVAPVCAGDAALIGGARTSGGSFTCLTERQRGNEQQSCQQQ